MREHYPWTACVLIASSVYVRINFTHRRSKKLRVTCCICNFVENENKKNWFWFADFPYWQGLGRARDWVRAVANCSMELFWRSCRGLWVKICPPKHSHNAMWHNPDLDSRAWVRVTGDAHITRVLGMGMPKTRECPYHCDSAIASSGLPAVPFQMISECTLAFGNCFSCSSSLASL